MNVRRSDVIEGLLILTLIVLWLCLAIIGYEYTKKLSYPEHVVYPVDLQWHLDETYQPHLDDGSLDLLLRCNDHPERVIPTEVVKTGTVRVYFPKGVWTCATSPRVNGVAQLTTTPIVIDTRDLQPVAIEGERRGGMQ